jgi:multidrug efflux pump subunit AcrB
LIAWFARNHVAANLLLVSIIALGFNAIFNQLPLEVFPAFERQNISVKVVYRGATPADIEESVITRVEEAIANLEGVKEIVSKASEGLASVNIEVDQNYDVRRLLEEVKARLDAVNSFPVGIERPIISQSVYKREVISVIISGDLSERERHYFGVQIRDELAALPNISQVELVGVRAFEIAIEIPELTLRQYQLTFDEVVTAIKNASIDLSAGVIKSSRGEIFLRTKGQAYRQADFENIPVITQPNGSIISLKDIAVIKDEFSEEPLLAKYNGTKSVAVNVYHVGQQNAIELANTVRQYIENNKQRFPENIKFGFWRDRSTIVKKRLNTLTNSAIQGGILVFILLTLFLHFRVALWICIGIPASFLGAMMLMPQLGVTINLISLFAFILVLGIVVDDAIVTGENIYSHLKKNTNGLQAAIDGTKEVAVPVTFGVLTTVVAFTPLLIINGRRGEMFAQISLIVIPVLLFSLFESKFILPAHLKNLDLHKKPYKFDFFSRIQRSISNAFEKTTLLVYQPILSLALKWRYAALACFTGLGLIILSLVISGHVKFIFFPKIPSEIAKATLVMPVGTPFEITSKYINQITLAAQQLKHKHIDPKTKQSIIRNILTIEGATGAKKRGQSHLGRVSFEITPPEDRELTISSTQLVKQWRQMIGLIPGAKDLTFKAEIGHTSSPINVQIAGNNLDRLTLAAAKIRQKLYDYPGVYDISDSLSDGKEEIKLTLKPQAKVLGLTLSDLAKQVRQAFFGEEIQRVQRNQEDVRIMVRYPLKERQSLASLEQMQIRTVDGTAIPFSVVANVHWGKSAPDIKRINRHRVVNVTADVNKKTTDLNPIKRDMKQLIDELKQQFPSLQLSFEGEERERRESFGSLGQGLLFVLFIIYSLLAIPFKSYLQPLIVLSVVPFGLIGAVLGHMILGLNLSIMSLFGMLALIGVVVNDSLVLVDYVNKQVLKGKTVMDAACTGGVARFRPIILTSLTTFVGLLPLIFEKSTQAQFLIPMAVSLGFGVFFATLITLILIPVNYLILEDLKIIKRFY